jgi:hypothetical protein
MRPQSGYRAPLAARWGDGHAASRRSAHPRTVAQLLLAVLLGSAGEAMAEEIRGMELAAPGHFKLEQRFGYSTTTFTPTSTTGPVVQHMGTGETELAYGLTEWWDIALTSPYEISRQQNPLGDAGPQYVAAQTGGVTIRNMFLQSDREERDLYFGVMVRTGYAPPGSVNNDLFVRNKQAIAPGDPAFIMEATPRYFGQISPIVSWRFGDGYQLLFNANFNFAIGSPGSSFEPNFRLVKHLNRKLAVGIEYFSNLGPIDQAVPLKQQQHRLLGVTLFKAWGLEWNLGLGYGLTPASNGVVANFGIEKELRPRATGSSNQRLLIAGKYQDVEAVAFIHGTFVGLFGRHRRRRQASAVPEPGGRDPCQAATRARRIRKMGP